MRLTTQICLLAISLCFFIGGCASSSTPVVTEPETFAKMLAKPDSSRIVLDARKPEDFEAGHAVGARPVDMNAWTKASREGAGLDDAAGWSTVIGSLGINQNTRVYVYDSGSMTNAARVWFILQHFGHKNTSVIDGGWKNLQPVLPSELIVKAAEPFSPATFVAKAHSGAAGVTTREELKSQSGTGTKKILDVRTTDEYTGKSKSDGGRGGHVPAACSLPHKEFLNDSGRLRTPEEIRAILAKQGMRPDEEVVIYCQSGGRASLGVLAATYAGYNHVSNYYMSMGEWLDDQSCPVE